MALVMAPWIMPEAHAATSCNLWVGDEEVTSDNTSGKGWRYGDGILWLDGFHYEGPGHETNDGGHAAIYYNGSGSLKINVFDISDNSINATGTYGIYIESSEENTIIDGIAGRAVLSIKAPMECIKTNNGGLILSDCFLEAESHHPVSSGSSYPDSVYAINAAGSVNIRNDSKVAVTAKSPQKTSDNEAAGIKADDVSITGSNVEACGYNAANSYGIKSKKGISLKNMRYLSLSGQTRAVSFSDKFSSDLSLCSWADMFGWDYKDDLNFREPCDNEALKSYKKIGTEGESEFEYTVSGYYGKYDGNDHGINISIAGNYNRINYSLNNSNIYKLEESQAPRLRDAGVYTVYYRIEGFRYRTVKGQETVIIEKVDPVITLPKKLSLTSDGSNQELLEPGTAEGGTMKYALGSDETTAPSDGWSEAVPKGNKAGEYHVWFRVDGDNNHYDISPKHIPVTIAEVQPIIAGPDAVVSFAQKILSRIPKVVTKATKKQVTAARAVYDELTTEQQAKLDKELVTRLKNAEKYIAEKDKYAAAVNKAKAKKVTIRSAKTKKGRKALVKWKAVSGISGYEIVYSTSKKFTKKTTKTLSAGSKSTKKTLSKLKAGKNYFVKIRTYKSLKNPTSGAKKKICGKWSKALKFKAKK